MHTLDLNLIPRYLHTKWSHYPSTQSAVTWIQKPQTCTHLRIVASASHLSLFLSYILVVCSCTHPYIVCFFLKCAVLGFLTQPFPCKRWFFHPVSVNGATVIWHSGHLSMFSSKSAIKPFPNFALFSHSSNIWIFIVIISTTWPQNLHDVNIGHSFQ